VFCFFGHALLPLFTFSFFFFLFPSAFSRLFLLLLPLRVDVVCIKSTISPKVFFFFSLALPSSALAHGVNSGSGAGVHFVKMGFTFEVPLFNTFRPPFATSIIDGCWVW
jgi:hypothetical protein